MDISSVNSSINTNSNIQADPKTRSRQLKHVYVELDPKTNEPIGVKGTFQTTTTPAQTSSTTLDHQSNIVIENQSSQINQDLLQQIANLKTQNQKYNQAIANLEQKLNKLQEPKIPETQNLASNTDQAQDPEQTTEQTQEPKITETQNLASDPDQIQDADLVQDPDQTQQIEPVNDQQTIKPVTVVEKYPAAKGTLTTNADPGVNDYDLTAGITSERLNKLIEKIVFNSYEKQSDDETEKIQKTFEDIKSNFFDQNKVNKQEYFAIKDEIKNTDLAELADQIDGLADLQKRLLTQLLVLVYNKQPIEDINVFRETVIKDALSPEKIGKTSKQKLHNIRENLREKIAWCREYFPDGPDYNKLFTAGNTYEEFIQELKQMQIDQAKQNYVRVLEDLEEQLTDLINSNTKAVRDRIEVIENGSDEPIIATEDNLKVEISKKKATIVNEASGATAHIRFNDDDIKEAHPEKIMFKGESSDVLSSLGVNIEDYATIGKQMPYIKYIGQDEDMPNDRDIMAKFYKEITKLLKGQDKIPAQVKKHLKAIHDYTVRPTKHLRVGEKAQILANQSAMVTVGIYTVLRVLGLASNWILGLGNTAVLDRFGGISLFLGEFVVRMPGSIQYSRVISNSIAKENERYTATPKELEYVRGENGPDVGLVHYITTEEAIFKPALEAGFLTSLGFKKVMPHFYAVGKQNYDSDQFTAFKVAEKDLLNWINNINSKVKDSWALFENNLNKLSKDQTSSFNKTLNFNCASLPENANEKHLEFIEKEYKRLSEVFKNISKAMAKRERFYRAKAREFTRMRKDGQMWFRKVADNWEANSKVFKNRADEVLRQIKYIKEAEGDKQSKLISQNLNNIREKYIEWEGKFHHKTILHNGSRFKRIDYDVTEKAQARLEKTLPAPILDSNIDDLLKNEVDITKFKTALDNILKLYNAGNARGIEGYLKKYLGQTLRDALPQILIEKFARWNFRDFGKAQDQSNLWMRFGRTFYKIKTAGRSEIEIPSEEFAKYAEKYLGKSEWTQQEWDAISQKDWSQLGPITNLFPTKPDRVEWPNPRFVYSLDKDYYSFSIDPETLEQKDISLMVAHHLRRQKMGETNIAVLQSRQCYLVDREDEKLAGAAQDDQKPWYGKFIFSNSVKNMLAKLAEVKRNLKGAQAQDYYVSTLVNLALTLKNQDKSGDMWPSIRTMLAAKSTKGLTEQDLDQILTHGTQVSPTIKNKVTYDLLELWMSNLLRFLLQDRKAAGMLPGKSTDGGEFNCGSNRMESVEMHRLAIQRFKVMNPTYAGAHCHSLVILSNETGDIKEYVPRAGHKKQEINPLVDLTKVNNQYLHSLISQYCTDLNISKVRKSGKNIFLYDQSGSIIKDYQVRLLHHENHYVKGTKRPKIVIKKLEYQGDKVVASKSYKTIYQYKRNFQVSQEDLEKILGVQETRPIQKIDVMAKDSAGMRKKLKGIMELKAGYTNQFIFDPAISSEADLEVVLRKEPPEVIEKMKNEYRKYQSSKQDLGTVVIDYTPSGKVISDWVPHYKNTRYVTRIDEQNIQDTMNHTAGTTDITTVQIWEQINSLKNNGQISFNFDGGYVRVKRTSANYYIEVKRKDGTKDIFKLNGSDKEYTLLHNDKAEQVFSADFQDSGSKVNGRYHYAAVKALSRKIKAIIQDEDYEIDYGQTTINSPEFKNLIKNPQNLNRTIYINDSDTITYNGKGNFNVSFDVSKPNASIMQLIAIAAKSGSKEKLGSRRVFQSEGGFEKKGSKWQSISLEKDGTKVHDLRITYATRNNSPFVIIQDDVTGQSVSIPYANGTSGKQKLAMEVEQGKAFKTISKWFQGNKAYVMDLQPSELQQLLNQRYGDKPIKVRKTRDRSNLALMLLNIKQMVPAGKFDFIKNNPDGSQQVHHLEFHNRLSKIVLDDIEYSDYETAIAMLDQKVFNSPGNVEIKSHTLAPRVVTTMIKTDDQGSEVVRRKLSSPRETMPDWWITEDAASTWEQRRRGFKVVYAPYNVADGMGPPCLVDLMNQHRRWALGTMNSFGYEPIKRSKGFMKTDAGKQLYNNEMWYKHGPYDEALYISPVALANTFAVSALSNNVLLNFNPLAADLGAIPVVIPILAFSIACTIINNCVYWPDMIKQGASIKDILLKESLISLLGCNSYINAYESHMAGVETDFDITSVGGDRQQIPYDALKKVNERLAMSLYSTTVFSGLLLKSLIELPKAIATVASSGVGVAAGIYGVLFSGPVVLALTSILVGFWSTFNAGKLIAAICAFDGLNAYWTDWKDGFNKDAENFTMKSQVSRAKILNSIDNLEKMLSVAKKGITFRKSSGDKNAVMKPDVGNFSDAFDLNLKKLSASKISGKNTVRRLENTIEILIQAEQTKVAYELLTRILNPGKESAEEIENILQKAKKSNRKNNSQTLVEARGRDRVLASLIGKFSNDVTLAPELNIIAARLALDLGHPVKALEYITLSLKAAQTATSTTSKSRTFIKAQMYLTEAYQQLALETKDTTCLDLAQELISGTSSSAELNKAFEGKNANLLAPLAVLREQESQDGQRRIVTRRLYNIKRFNQAKALFDLYKKTNDPAIINRAYSNFALLSEKTPEMGVLGSQILTEIQKLQPNSDLRTALKEQLVSELNKKLSSIPLQGSIELLNTGKFKLNEAKAISSIKIKGLPRIDLKNHIKRTHQELNALLAQIIELADKDDKIQLQGTFVNISPNSRQAAFDKVKNTYYVKHVPHRRTDTRDGKTIWADTKANQEPDMIVRHNKYLLRQLMSIAKLSVPGYNNRNERRSAMILVAKDGFLRSDLMQNKITNHNVLDQVEKAVNNIIARLTEIGRYDEAAKFYSYFIPTLKLPGKLPKKPRTIGQFIEKTYSVVDEQDSKDMLIGYQEFLNKYGDQLAHDNGKVIAFQRKYRQNLTEKVDGKKFTEDIANIKTLRDEISDVHNYAKNMIGENTGAKAILEAKAEVEVQTIAYYQQEFIKAPSIETLTEYLDQTDWTTANNLITYLRSSAENLIEASIAQAVDQLSSKLTAGDLMQIMSTFAQKEISASNTDSKANELKTQLETYFQSLIADQKPLSDAEKENIEQLFVGYLQLGIKGADINTELAGPIYKDILNQDPAESSYLQMAISSLQDHFEDTIANSILVIKGTKNEQIFTKTLEKFIKYVNFATNINENTSDQSQDLGSLIRLMKVGRARLKPERLLGYLSEFTKIAADNCADVSQKLAIADAIDQLKDKLNPSDIKQVLAAQCISLRSIALLRDPAKVQAQFNQIISMTNSPEFKKLLRADRQKISLKIVEEYIEAQTTIINDTQAANAIRIKAIAMADQALNQYINNDSAPLKLEDNDAIRWKLDITRFDLKCTIEKLFADKTFSLTESQQLRDLGIIGYNKDELIKYATSAMVEFSKRVEEHRETLKEVDERKQTRAIDKSYMLNPENKKGVNQNIALNNVLMGIVLKHKLFEGVENIKDQNPVLQKAFSFLKGTIAKNAVAISKKIIALSKGIGKFDQVKFEKVATATDFNPKGLRTDAENINIAYNPAKPPAAKSKQKAGKPTSIGMWFKQKASAVRRAFKSVKEVLKHKKLWFVNRLVNRITLAGSIGASAVGGVAMAAIWGLYNLGVTALEPAILVITNPWISMGIFAACTLGGAIFIPPLYRLARNIAESIFSTIKGNQDQKFVDKKLI